MTLTGWQIVHRNVYNLTDHRDNYDIQVQNVKMSKIKKKIARFYLTIYMDCTHRKNEFIVQANSHTKTESVHMHAPWNHTNM